MISALIHLADTNLILGHRLSEWTGHGPALEQDIALTNIALDHVGLSRNLYQYAADLINADAVEKTNFPLHSTGLVTEDSLAYLRDAVEYRNLLMVELPNGHWGYTLFRLLCMAVWQKELLRRLGEHPDERLAGLAAKSLKELQYHVQWSTEWVVRLGDGTAESAARMQEAVQHLWPHTGEMFEAQNPLYALLAPGTAHEMKEQWLRQMHEIAAEAQLSLPAESTWHQSGGLQGMHTEHLGFLLAEMQFLQRAYPGAEW